MPEDAAQGDLFDDDDKKGTLFRDEDAPLDSYCAAHKGTKVESVCERTGAHPDYPFSAPRGTTAPLPPRAQPGRRPGISACGAAASASDRFEAAATAPARGDRRDVEQVGSGADPDRLRRRAGGRG